MNDHSLRGDGNDIHAVMGQGVFADKLFFGSRAGQWFIHNRRFFGEDGGCQADE